MGWMEKMIQYKEKAKKQVEEGSGNAFLSRLRGHELQDEGVRM